MAGCTFPPKPMLFPPNFNTQRRAKVSPGSMTNDPIIPFIIRLIQPGVPLLSHRATAVSCTRVDPSRNRDLERAHLFRMRATFAFFKGSC